MFDIHYCVYIWMNLNLVLDFSGGGGGGTYGSLHNHANPAARGGRPEVSTGNPLMRGAGGPPQVKRVLFTFFASRLQEKEPKLKKRQWCLWRFLCPLSMRQFIEISKTISVSVRWKKNMFKHLDVERPGKVCALSNGSVPCTAAET